MAILSKLGLDSYEQTRSTTFSLFPLSGFHHRRYSPSIGAVRAFLVRTRRSTRNDNLISDTPSNVSPVGTQNDGPSSIEAAPDQDPVSSTRPSFRASSESSHSTPDSEDLPPPYDGLDAPVPSPSVAGPLPYGTSRAQKKARLRQLQELLKRDGRLSREQHIEATSLALELQTGF